MPEVVLAARGIGHVVVLSLPRENVEALLPDGLELSDTVSDVASVSLLFVKQIGLGIQLPFGEVTLVPEYKEMILAINEVRKIGGRKSYWNFQKLYLDSWPAIIGGWYLAYPKKYGVLSFEKQSAAAQTPRGSKLAYMTFQNENSFDEREFAKGFNKIKQLLSQPVIQQGAFGWVCSQFSWNFETASAFPIRAQGRIFERLRPAISGEFQAQGLNQFGVGGYSLESDWVLRGPVSCD